jgi:hypothetical protein
MIEKWTAMKKEEEEVAIRMTEMRMIVMILLMKYDDEGDEDSGAGAGCCHCFTELRFLSMSRAADLVEGRDAPSTLQVTCLSRMTS